MKISALLSGSAVLLLTCAAQAADDFYLKIPGIPGDVATKGFEGYITVTSFAEGFSSEASANGSGAGASKASCQEFKVVKPLDGTSPLIALAVVKGQTFNPIQFFVVKEGESARSFLTFTLINAVISAVHFAGDEVTSARLETLKITPARVTISYTPQDAAGAPGTTVQTTVDCSRNNAAT